MKTGGRDLIRWAPRLGAAILTLAAGLAAAQADERPHAVVELFTSQGCSSCPPADALMAKLAGEAGLIALTLPVDYWDYLGWRDTLAQRAFTKRQKAYAEGRGDRKVYTPQIVVNGRYHAVGSDASSIRGVIAKSSGGGDGLLAAATTVRSGNGFTVTVAEAPGWRGRADILIAVFDDSVPVAIDRGENGGRKVVYHHVVRRMKSVAQWAGLPLTIEIPDMALGDRQGAAVLVQKIDGGRHGAIVAAAAIEP